MMNFGSLALPTARWFSALLWAGALSGCAMNDAPPAPKKAAPALADLAVANLPPVAVPVPAVAAIPTPAAEKPWDSCSPQDPNPWPWRSEAEGMWGENPLTVPPFALKQERRAAKMPDAGRYLKSLARTNVKSEHPLLAALLICEVETYSHNGQQPTLYQYKLPRRESTRRSCPGDWDAFNAPDILLRFRFRGEYPLTLFGPEDHWGFFVSIPNVTLAVGDTLSVKLWDRDSGTYWNGYVNEQKNEFMGAAALKFDGSLPLTLHAEFFTMRCNAMPAAQTHALAKSLIAQLDGSLRTARDWRPDVNRWDFGQKEAAESVGADFGHGIFRYPAGILGWEAPEIQSRLQVVQGLAAADGRKRRERVTELLSKSPPATTGSYNLDDGRGTLRFQSTQCRSDGCKVHAEVSARILKELCTQGSTKPVWRAAGIDDSGKFAGAFTEIKKAGSWQSCNGEQLATTAALTPVHINVLGASVLFWLGGVGKAAIFKLPASAP